MEDPTFEMVLVVTIAVGATWAAARLKVPSIVVLLIAGVLAGAGFGILDPDMLAGELLLPFVSIAVGLILFEGGLSLRLHEIKDSEHVVWLLVTVGVAVTWMVGAAASLLLLDVSLPIGVLLGAILVVSGPTVIGPILRSVRPSRTVSSVLKWESIVIDPIGAMLTVVVAEVILAANLGSAGIVREAGLFIVVGVAAGLVVSVPTAYSIRRHLIPERLVPLVGIGAALVAFSLANGFADESGLLATTVLGLTLANNPRLRTESIIRFSEVIQVLLVGVLFVLLSARLTRSDLAAISIGVVGLILALGLVARPAAVAISTWRSKLSLRERLFLAGVAPRGIVAAAVASVFTLELEEAGVEGAEALTPVTFAVIVGTVLLYGLGAGPLARRLELAEGSNQGVLIVGAGPVEQEVGGALAEAGITVMFASTNRRDEMKMRMQGHRTYYGNLINHEIMSDIDLSGIGRVFAITPNDEVNTLAARQFVELFGAAESYQISAEPPGPGINRYPADLGGRILFSEELTYSELASRIRNGQRMRRTAVGAEFTPDGFRESLDENDHVLFLIRDDQLLVAVQDEQKSLIDRARSGDTILWI
jgi:NhaP-type Na+/H+ or K+/H+ antiporter